MTSTTEIAALILPWAKETHPEKYQATLGVATNDRTFRRYLIRLIEIRWSEDKGAWLRSVPLNVLEDSAIELTVRHRRTGKLLVVKGRLAGPRTWSFGELERLMDEGDGALDTLMTVKEVFDLEVV